MKLLRSAFREKQEIAGSRISCRPGANSEQLSVPVIRRNEASVHCHDLFADRRCLRTEPGTALDVTIQDQDSQADQNRSGGFRGTVGYHGDAFFGVIRQVTTEVNIMYAGTMVEGGDNQKVFEHPIHPYTEALDELPPETDRKRNR